MSDITHLPMTVGATLEAVSPDSDAVVVLFRGRTSQAWRVGWSVMPLSDLCLAKELLTHEVQNMVRSSYVNGTK